MIRGTLNAHYAHTHTRPHTHANAHTHPRIHRGYSGKKLEDNVTAEIMNVILDEACDAYKPEVVREMESNTVDDMDENVDAIKQFVEEFRARHR